MKEENRNLAKIVLVIEKAAVEFFSLVRSQE